ncbi:GntP family permease [Neomegalonema sp.]|uniref:GntP family permease n=1 Tax=Neomegalonema sp. TaxID=2039713 RepID=UPI002607D091|nr:GntP family permease [Neomegalonema sp.]MDD2868343.1 GntP family permease [Neomegalonema sp.]
MGLLGVVLSLVLLMYLAYRGVNVLILAPLLALLAVLFSGDLPILGTYTQIFMKALGGYVATFFPLFMLGAIFGKLMADSGSARAIAEWIVTKLGSRNAILAVVLSCAALTYGGVSLFVVAFAVYPIAAELFRKAEIPKRLIPATIALGAFTFTMTALPGSPAIQNAIPTPYFGTTPFAAPLAGVLGGAIMFLGGMAWLRWRAAQAVARSEGYGDHPPSSAESAVTHENPPGVLVALTPAFSVIALNALFTYVVLPRIDSGFLAEPAYGSTTLESVRGVWAIISALTLSILLLIALNWARLKTLRESLNAGTMGSLLPIFNTASEVGYGATIASLPAFALVRDAVMNVSPDNPLVSVAVATNVLAGITGSASGGLSIALQTLGDHLNAMAQATGVSPELMHRVAAMSSGGFDTLPHNGAVITLLAICGLSHRQSYFDIFVAALIVPVLATFAVVLVGGYLV